MRSVSVLKDFERFGLTPFRLRNFSSISTSVFSELGYTARQQKQKEAERLLYVKDQQRLLTDPNNWWLKLYYINEEDLNQIANS